MRQGSGEEGTLALEPGLYLMAVPRDTACVRTHAAGSQSPFSPVTGWVSLRYSASFS